MISSVLFQQVFPRTLSGKCFNGWLGRRVSNSFPDICAFSMLNPVPCYLMGTTKVGVLLSGKGLQVSATAFSVWSHWCSRVRAVCSSTQQGDPVILNALVTSVPHASNWTVVRKVM